MKIFLDAGHGGNDPGAIGNNLQEKNVTLAVAKRVQYHLERLGQTVIMSRTSDSTVSLSSRTINCNSKGCDIAISIHCNAFNGNAKGLETYTYAKQTNEIKLAQAVHNSIISAKLFTVNRGIKQANFHMVRETKMPAILVELAFIDNLTDSNLLKNKQEEFAIAITKGILNYFELDWKEETVKTTEKSLYIVSVGAYSNKDNATKLMNELKAKGYNPYLHTCN